MTTVRPMAIGEQSDAASPGRRAGDAKRRAYKILAAVDGTERTGRIVEYLIKMAESGVLIEVVVLNVQPEPEDWRLRGYGSFKQDEVRDRLVNDLGKPIVASVSRGLDQCGVVHKGRIELGESAKTILKVADEEHCDLIVVSGSRPGTFRRWLTSTTGLSFGSVTTSVAQLAEMSVVIVK